MSQAGPDDWLGDLYLLLFMDDTVTFSSTREKLEEKLYLLKRCTNDIGMSMHPSKSQFISVNKKDNQPIQLDSVTIKPTHSYIYLGTPIADASITQQVELHVNMKSCHTYKFSSFLLKNSDAPYLVKQSVWRSALNAAILYSCETWLSTNFKRVEKLYMSTLKEMLGVRITTSNNLVLLESGEPDVKNLIRDRQQRFIRSLISREMYPGSYLNRLISLAIQVRSPMGLVLETLATNGFQPINYSSEGLEHLRVNINNSEKTRDKTYKEINPSLSTSVIYCKDSKIPEYARIAITRLRLSSHRLRIETGRWSRLPKEERLCSCGMIQTEEHIVLNCVETRTLRLKYVCVSDIQSVAQLLNSCDLAFLNKVALYCYEVLKHFT